MTLGNCWTSSLSRASCIERAPDRMGPSFSHWLGLGGGDRAGAFDTCPEKCQPGTVIQLPGNSALAYPLSLSGIVGLLALAAEHQASIAQEPLSLLTSRISRPSSPSPVFSERNLDTDRSSFSRTALLVTRHALELISHS